MSLARELHFRVLAEAAAGPERLTECPRSGRAVGLPRCCAGPSCRSAEGAQVRRRTGTEAGRPTLGRACSRRQSTLNRVFPCDVCELIARA